jgi:septin family protein
VKKLHSKFDISSLLLDINIALTSKQKDIEASESHLVQEIKQEKEKEVQKSLFTFERKVKKEKENIIRELQEKKKALKKTLFAEVKYLKSLYYTLESTRKSFEESTQKVSYTF